ncbi:MAG: acyl-CoA thioesterase [Candidatus Methylacidiphilales bacterium]
MALPEKPELTVPVKIYFYDTDAGGVVHNVAYLRIIEMARSEFAEYLGWPLKEMAEPGADCPVVARTEIDYVKPARLGDELEMQVRLSSIQRVRFIIELTLIRKTDGEVLCRCRQVMVPVDLASGRPRPLRTDWREKWGECP